MCRYCNTRLDTPPRYEQEVPAQQPGVERFIVPGGPTSGLAFAAGYLGIFSLLCSPLGPIAIIVGLLAIRDIKKRGNISGKGRAISGVVMGTIGTVLFFILFKVQMNQA